MPANVPVALRPGALVGGKYRIDRVIARGGQGTVVEATHLALRQSVAIKFSHLDREPGNRRTERLLREARAVGRLRGEHVARVIDVDSADDMPFIVMEYLRGIDLKRLIATRGPLPSQEAVGMVLQACDGLAEAHDLGIVHRDLKPSNLFLVQRPDGPPLVKVLDFGIARDVGPIRASDADADLTEPLVLLGTPGYMAPEQARDSHNIDARADVWSLGLILYELLTGQPAFRARTPADVLALVLLKNPTPVSLLRPEVPAGIERIILRCLQKQPEHRFATVRELAAELMPFGPASDNPATASNPLVTPPKGTGARAGLWVAGAAILLAGIGLRVRASPPPAARVVAPLPAAVPDVRPLAEVSRTVEPSAGNDPARSLSVPASPAPAEAARSRPEAHLPGPTGRRRAALLRSATAAAALPSRAVKAPRFRPPPEPRSAASDPPIHVPADVMDPLDGRK